jgi:hypothetical protein
MSIKPYLVLMLTLVAADSAVAVCNNAMQKSTPDQAFTLHYDGTVIHNATALMWMRCVLGQTWEGATCTGSAQSYSWSDALQAANGYSFAGYSDWRLPNKNELASIVEEACYNPAINTFAFPDAPSWYVWSSSPHAYGPSSGGRWRGDFNYGHVEKSYGIYDAHVRLVRGGQ